MGVMIPPNEESRLAALRAAGILGEERDEELEDLVRIAAQLCDSPVAQVTLIDADRQWVRAGPCDPRMRSTPREDAFCAHTILGSDILVVRDATLDARFRANPYVVAHPNIRFYAGAPLRMPTGVAVGALCIVDYVPRELTDRARAALDALRRHAEAVMALRAANRALDLAHVQKERLVEYLAHDVKNAIGTVILCGEELAGGHVASVAEAAEVGGFVLASARRVETLMLDMIDSVRAERTGSLPVKPTVLDADALFRAAATGLARASAARGATIAVEPSGLRVRGDGELVRRVLENLLDNALRYSTRGSAIVLSARATPNEVTLRVSDFGPGIPEDQRAAVFELYESEAPTSRSRGIGLAFCRLATLAMNGRIHVEATPDGGATFCVTLPRA